MNLNQLQQYIKKKDHKPELKNAYFQKLIEEVGELSEAIRKNKRLEEEGSIKGTIEEELYDVLYYITAIANIHDIDLKHCMRLKAELNLEKYS
ncbi:hypothetical protein D3H55_14015 [Bacillus salacetis]|uniref:NTP pyrophosphohydrolase MazG-like domain-containing protein n=1 Tax=Bacillus salacetis TaxID=2315464 RepID=A0A3A1R021_9BACI|nr:hypothetical protein D3H55_14015 [Bacillus salacetis]